MFPRPVVTTLVVSLGLAVVVVACGTSGAAGPTGPEVSAAPRVSAVTVAPPSGPLGTTFTLSARGLKTGDAVAFEITFPGEGKAFPGAALVVLNDGIATTTYRATSANQPGLYSVRLTGAVGTLAEGRFTVTDGPPLTSTIEPFPSGTGTSTTAKSGRTTTTVKGGSTTTTRATTGSSTTKPTATTTATTIRKAVTTSSSVRSTSPPTT